MFKLIVFMLILEGVVCGAAELYCIVLKYIFHIVHLYINGYDTQVWPIVKSQVNARSLHSKLQWNHFPVVVVRGKQYHFVQIVSVDHEKRVDMLQVI